MQDFLFYSFIFFIALYPIAVISNVLICRHLIKYFRYQHVDHMSYFFKISAMGIVFFLLTIILHIFHINHFSWYILSALIISFGIWGIMPTQMNIYGRKITDGIFIRPDGIQTYLIHCKGKKLHIYAERLLVKNKKVIVVENPAKGFKKYLPPHQNEMLSQDEYNYIVNLVVDYLRKQGYEVEFT